MKKKCIKHRYELNVTKVLNKWPTKPARTISWNPFLNFSFDNI